MLATFQNILPHEKLIFCEKLPQSGSHREYYRLKSDGNKSYIGVFNENIQENKAFIDYTRQLKHYINVPKIIVPNWGKSSYIIEDLGDTVLLSIYDKKIVFDDEMEEYYKILLDDLYKIQTKLGDKFDFSEVCEKSIFDREAILFDLNYFKYYFLKLAGIKYNEEKLQKDFEKFADYILSLGTNTFVFRDFHAGNIMVKDGNFYYIDYQGGRLGNAYYDLASLLYSGKTVIDENRRERLLNYYLKITHLNIESFYFVALFRIMQAMGSYGFRGFFERKARFLKSIPNACRNVESILKKQRSYENDVKSIAEKYPEIFHCFIQIIEYGKSLENKIKPKSNLTVEINSFSYRFGIPNDDSGNGGGFVFDCRSLQNPGRYDLYKDKNSRDHQEVRSFLQGQPAITEFLDNVWNIVKPAVQNYVDRNFAHLQISFGCTGGQHRSVYCAEKIAKKLREEFDITLKVEHLQL